MSSYFDSLASEGFEQLANRTQLHEFAKLRVSRYHVPANDEHAALDDAFESIIGGSLGVRGQELTL